MPTNKEYQEYGKEIMELQDMFAHDPGQCNRCKHVTKNGFKNQAEAEANRDKTGYRCPGFLDDIPGLIVQGYVKHDFVVDGQIQPLTYDGIEVKVGKVTFKMDIDCVGEIVKVEK